MAINSLIAQGIKPLGSDLPQIANMLQDKRQADTRNALMQTQLRREDQQYNQGQEDRQNKVALAQLQWAAQPGLSKDQIGQAVPQVKDGYEQANGEGSWAAASDEDVRGTVKMGLQHISSRLGIGPVVAGPKNYIHSNVDENVYEVGIDGKLTLAIPGIPKPKPEDNQLVNVDDGRGGYKTIRRNQFVEGRDRIYEKPTEASDAKPQRVNVMLPDGSTQETWIRPGQTSGQPIGAPVRQRPTESQAKANVFGQRMMESDRIISGTDYSPAAINAKAAAGGIPLIGGALEMGGNMMLGENNQMAEQAQRDFINAVLRKESGSAISNSEFENARKQYFPQALDSPKVKEQKQRNRQLAIAGMRAEAANFWGAGVEGQGGASPAPESAAARAHRMGL